MHSTAIKIGLYLYWNFCLSAKWNRPGKAISDFYVAALNEGGLSMRKLSVKRVDCDRTKESSAAA